MKKRIRIAWKIIETMIKDQVHYPSRLIIETINMIARCGILLLLYWYVFKLNNGLINGSSFQLVAWSIFFYFANSTLNLRNVSRTIARDVKSGSVEMFFVRPFSYLAYRVWWQVGSGLYPFLVIAPIGSLALYFLIGIPQSMLIGIFLPSFLLVFLGGTILTLILYSIVGLLAFWLEDIDPVYWILDKAVMILGGSYLPIALFPPLMKQIAIYSPFGASIFVTHTVSAEWASVWYWQFGIQVFWIMIMGGVLKLILNGASRRLSVNGG